MSKSDGRARRNLTNAMRELYESRSVLLSLINKNLVGRYKNSLLGLIWHFITPIMMLIIYYIVFTQIRIRPIDDFWLYLASGLFIFNFMLNCLTSGSLCIVNNSGLVKKMYIPREYLVLSHTISSFIVMMIGYLIVLTVVIITGHNFTLFTLTMIPVIIMSLLFATGCVFIFSSMAVYVRDIHHLLSVLSPVLFFITPIYFLVEDVTGILEIVIWLNPFSYYVAMMHDAFYYGEVTTSFVYVVGLVLSIVVLLTGVLLFRKLKRGFAERL